VAPSRSVGVSASVNLPLHHKVQKFSLAPAHPGGPGHWTKSHKTDVVVVREGQQHVNRRLELLFLNNLVTSVAVYDKLR